MAVEQGQGYIYGPELIQGSYGGDFKINILYFGMTFIDVDDVNSFINYSNDMIIERIIHSLKDAAREWVLNS